MIMRTIIIITNKHTGTQRVYPVIFDDIYAALKSIPAGYSKEHNEFTLRQIKL
jgi:hypothetical protein